MDKRPLFFGQFWKLGFCSARECQIFAHGGQIRKLIDRECVASVPTWNMPKHVLHDPPEASFDTRFPNSYAPGRDSNVFPLESL